MPVRVCVAIRESTTAAAVVSAQRAAQWADLVEIRADYIRDLDLRFLLREKHCPVIFTLRARHEGGNYSGLEQDRIRTILQAAQEGADYVDVEFSANWNPVLESVPKARVILSQHDFEGTPARLEVLLETMASTGAGILKVVTRARCLADNVRIARLLNYASAQRLNLIALAMGESGIPSRVLGGHWGSWTTFASLPGGDSTAEGQIPADEMESQFRIRQIGFATQLYGVLGKPLKHSLSPLIHNAAFATRGLNAVFIPLEAASVDDFVEFQEMLEFQGTSVTIPYKEQVLSFVRTLSVAADRIGSVNTLVRKGNAWHGENTDVVGFLRPLDGRVDLVQKRAVVLGSGGAARAVVYALCAQGAAVCVVARNEAKARNLATTFGAEYASMEKLGNIRWDLLVNATPVGMYPDVEASPVRGDHLNGEWVYDLVYNPLETQLLKDAARRGCKTIAGTEMFLGQALQQQQLWLGSPAPEKVMRDALNKALDRSKTPEGGHESLP